MQTWTVLPPGLKGVMKLEQQAWMIFRFTHKSGRGLNPQLEVR